MIIRQGYYLRCQQGTIHLQFLVFLRIPGFAKAKVNELQMVAALLIVHEVFLGSQRVSRMLSSVITETNMSSIAMENGIMFYLACLVHFCGSNLLISYQFWGLL